jgi:hypothetical protein
LLLNYLCSLVWTVRRLAYMYSDVANGHDWTLHANKGYFVTSQYIYAIQQSWLQKIQDTKWFIFLGGRLFLSVCAVLLCGAFIHTCTFPQVG